MRKVLFVAEKNDVAKNIAAILSNGTSQRKEGRSKYNKIYQLQTTFMGQQSQLSVTSVSGHLMNWQFGPELKDWQNVAIRRLFDEPVHHLVIPTMKDIERTLREEAGRAECLVIWTDCDREGENIGAEIVKVCTESNRHLDVYRAKFSEVTARAVQRAIAGLVRLDTRMVEAVDCRQELDLRIGAAFTRLQTLHLRQSFAHVLSSDGKQVVSYGSCQFPTLGFVVDRYKAIQSFIEETFWKLVVEHTREGMKVEFAWDRVRLFDRDIVNVLFDECQETATATVESVTKKPKSKYRPQVFEILENGRKKHEFEKLAVRKLKISAKVAMTIAEKLYNRGFISYPRTETNAFPKDINLDSLVCLQTGAQDWGDFAAQIQDKGVNPRNGSKSDEAHPPIHPLKFADRTTLMGNEWRVYELIVRHFLACVSWDAKGQETRVVLSVGEERFLATGLHIEDLGYMLVYPYDKWSDKVVPRYQQGEQLRDFALRIADGKTQPPLLLNEEKQKISADLISLMDKFGIGTDATHAEHIEKIKGHDRATKMQRKNRRRIASRRFKVCSNPKIDMTRPRKLPEERQYVDVKDDGRFYPGYLGLALVDGYDEMGYAMSKPQLRADLERKLVGICQGHNNKQQVLAEQLEKYRRIFIASEQNVSRLSQALSRYLNSNDDRIRPAARAAAPARGGGAAGARGGRGRGRGRGGRGGPQVAQVPAHELVGPAPVRRRGRPRVDLPAAGASRGGGHGAGGAGPGGGGDAPKCQCTLDAVMRTVQKEGANKGRKFWVCSKGFGMPDKCGFFQWAD